MLRLTGRIGSIVRRQPSPATALAVALVALFLAIAGIGYAATSLPRGSVGTEQLRNNAVTGPKIRNLAVGNHKLAGNAVGFRKIIPGTIGAARVNRNAVQLRVTGTCAGGQPTGAQATGGGQAIASIQSGGQVSCARLGSPAFSGQSAAVDLAGTERPIIRVSLPAGSAYAVLANPSIDVGAATNASGHIGVVCELSTVPAGSFGASALQQKALSFDVGGFGAAGANPSAVQASLEQQATMPLQVSVASKTVAQTATIQCDRSLSGTNIGTPTVTATGAIIVIATSSRGSLPTTVPTLPDV